MRIFFRVWALSGAVVKAATSATMTLSFATSFMLLARPFYSHSCFSFLCIIEIPHDLGAVCLQTINMCEICRRQDGTQDTKGAEDAAGRRNQKLIFKKESGQDFPNDQAGDDRYAAQRIPS